MTVENAETLAMLVLIILFVGDPDLMDALIHAVMK